MQKHYNYLNIDLDKKIHTKLKAKQGDSKSRYILVNLISNSTYYDLSDCAVKIYGIKKDKTIFFNHATVTNAKQGRFEIELTNQALAVPGEIEIQILILGTNQEKLTTFSFFIDVNKTIIDDAAIESTNEFTALTEALSSVQNIDNRFREVDEQFNTIESEKTYSSYLNKALVTIIDDDCHPLFLTRVKPVLEANNVKCSLCVPASQVGLSGTMTLEQLISLQNEGYEILSHGHNGILMNMPSTSEMDNDLKLAKQYFKENGLDDKNILIYNGGNYNTDAGREVKRIARQYYKYAFNNFGSNAPYIDNFMIGRTDFNAKDLTTLKNEVDNAIKYRSYLVLMLHSWQDTFDSDKLDQLIKYIQSKSIDIVLASEGVKLKANYIDYGDRDIYGGTKIDSNGKLTANFITLDASNVNRNVYDYPYGRSTVYVSGYIAGFTPIPSGLKDYSWAGYPCIIEVTRTGLDSCEQVLTLRYLKRIRYTRNWSTSTNNWTEWIPEFSYINVDVMANADILKNISNYDKNVVTEFRVAAGVNTPESKAGIIQVHRLADDAYSYMEFVTYDEAKKYKSKWNAGTNKWDEWTLYNQV